MDVVALAPVGPGVGDDAVGYRDERRARRREHVVAGVDVAVAGGAERVLGGAVVDLADDRHERAGVAALLTGGLALPLLAREISLAHRDSGGRARRDDAQGIGRFGALRPGCDRRGGDGNGRSGSHKQAGFRTRVRHEGVHLFVSGAEGAPRRRYWRPERRIGAQVPRGACLRAGRENAG